MHIPNEIKEIVDISNDSCINIPSIERSLNYVYSMQGIRVTNHIYGALYPMTTSNHA